MRRERVLAVLDLLSAEAARARATSVQGGVPVQTGVVARTVGGLLHGTGLESAHHLHSHAVEVFLVRTRR